MMAAPLLLALSIGCRAVPEPVMGGPMTVKAALALHSPPEVVVEKERIHPLEDVNLGAHLISLVPFVAGFAQPQTEVTIRTDGEISWVGVYGTGGRLRSAHQRRGQEWFHVNTPSLRSLDRRLAIATRVAPDVDGSPGKWVALPVDPAIREAYLSGMVDATDADPEQRGALVREALAVYPTVGGELVHWLREHGTDADVADALTRRSLGRVGDQLVEAVGVPPPIRPLDPGLHGLLSEMAAEPRGSRTGATVLCMRPDAQAASLVVSRHVCGMEEGWATAVDTLARCKPKAVEGLVPLIPDCESEVARGLLLVVTGMPVGATSDIVAALRGPEPVHKRTVEHLDFGVSIQREAVEVVVAAEEVPRDLAARIRAWEKANSP